MKLTLEFIKKQFEKKNCILISKEYINNQQKLDYICQFQKVHAVSWNNWRRKNGCPCFSESIRKKRILKQIKSSLLAEGYILLSKIYVDVNQKLETLCPEKHKYSTSWRNWKRGSRCPYCSNSARLDIEFIKRSFEKEKYTLLSIVYKNSKSKLEYQCPKSHFGSITWANWNQGYRCRKCYAKSHTGENNPNWNGGSSFEPYCPIWTDSEFMSQIAERDKDKFCWNPLCNGKSSRRMRHHIDYNKKNCNLNNVITVCNSCNSRANFNREWWTKFYSKIMRERYDFKEAVGI